MPSSTPTTKLSARTAQQTETLSETAQTVTDDALVVTAFAVTSERNDAVHGVKSRYAVTSRCGTRRAPGA
jgi:hypothetical protein